MKNVLRPAVTLMLALTFGAQALAAPTPAPPKPLPRPFGRGHAYYHKTVFAPYRFKDTIVRVGFDFAKGIVYGDETAVVIPKRAGLRRIPFNTLGIHYKAVAVNGKPAAYRLDAAHQRIYVALQAPAAAGQPLTVTFRYWAQPQRGIYFIRPDKGYPRTAPEIWSQGEMTDNRRWFPTWDEPNQKTPSELIVTVPRGWTVVGNGYLKSVVKSAKLHAWYGTQSDVATWDWNAPIPKSTYLIAFAAGPLSEHRTSLDVPQFQGHKPLPVDSFVQPRYAKWNALCFGKTKRIVAYFQKRIGIAFPWEKYDQVTAERFTYGGMENASVTIQTSNAIHPPIENLEQPCDGLVAHELAHQWWGDDVTLSDWSNVWINEGFATFFQELWSRHHFGRPEFQYERYNAQQAYFGETKSYWRPIVDYVYDDPLDNFDASAYPRPAQVLHMLQYMVGTHRFFAALHYYLEQYQHKNADTQQFFSAIDKSLGTNLTWFEHEWFFRAAYPHYYVKQRYDAKTKTLALDVTQKNHDGKPFRMPIVIQAYFGNQIKSVRPTIDRNHQVVTIPGVAQAPSMVLFDPNDNVIRKLTWHKSLRALAYQAIRARYAGDRLWALGQLERAKKGERKGARRTIREMALFDSFYGVRADAVAAAARLGDWQTVRAALHDRDERVVIAAAQDAGRLKGTADPTLVADLRRLAGSPNPLAAAAALSSLGALKAPGAYALLVAALGRPSFREQIPAGALMGLGALGNMKAFPSIEARTAYGTPLLERSAAIFALARLAVKNERQQSVEGHLIALAESDPIIGTRIAAVHALGMLGETSAIPALQRIEASDSQQAVQSGAWSAILDIKDAAAMRAYKASRGHRRK